MASLRVAVAAALLVAGVVAAAALVAAALRFNTDLALADPPLARATARIEDPRTPRLARRVYLVIVDGLRFDHSALPYLDGLRRRGASIAAVSHYPTWSRPNYVTITTGVPPPASGVRTNRVPYAVPFDSLMERAHAAGLRVASAGDIGLLPTLFVRTPLDLADLEYRQDGDRTRPPAGASWPFDDVRKASDTERLGLSIATLVAGDAELVVVLAGAVDRAGHARGADSTAYDDAAAEVDRMLGRALAGVDLARDAIVVTADHGHGARGGHGGIEPEVSAVPLILAGAGVLPGARTANAGLADVSPTVAALLGIPAPGHAFGRTLVELVQLPPEAARRRLAADDARVTAMAGALAGVSDRPDVAELALVAAGVALALGLGWWLARRGALAIPGAAPVAAIGFAGVAIGLAVVTRGQISPSMVPTKDRLEKYLALLVVAGIAIELVAAQRVLRRRQARLATANGLALVGLVASVAPPCAVAAWFAAPYLEVPSPFWLVAIPAGELAGACGAAAAAVVVAVELVRCAVRRTSA